MNMDRKIRQAFQSATPNVLGALPAKEQKRKKNRHLPGKILNALPAVASLAIILGAVALAIPYIASFSGPGSLNQPTETTTQATKQHDPGLMEQIRAHALSIVAQEGETLTAECTVSDARYGYYKVTIRRQGIIYRLYYNEVGRLYRVDQERTETATGLIPESVAYAMAWTDWGLELENPTVALKTAPEGFPYYAIRAVAPESNWEFHRYVHAENGKLFLNDPVNADDEELILADALSIVAPDGQQPQIWIVELGSQVHDYMVRIEDKGTIYYLFYARSGLLQRVELIRTADAQGDIPENVAFHLARLEVGASCVLQSVERKTVSDGEVYYRMKLERADGSATFTYYVNADTGAVYLEEGPDWQPPAASVANAALRDQLAADALAIVAQENEELEAQVSLEMDLNDRYLVVIERQGIEYRLYYDKMGILCDLRVERLEGATDVIPRSVAYWIVRLDWGIEPENYAIEYKTYPDRVADYRVVLMGKVTITRYINAETGEIYRREPEDSAKYR